MAMLLHGLADLPLHHDDAHRQLWPLSDWRYASPLSYWDPRHYGHWVALAELTAVAFSSGVIWRRQPQTGPRILLAAVLISYVAYAAYAIRVWV